MKKRIAILVCLFAVSFPVVPLWGQESSELNLTAGATKQIDDILLNDISDFKFGWTRKMCIRDSIVEDAKKYAEKEIDFINKQGTDEKNEWYKCQLERLQKIINGEYS